MKKGENKRVLLITHDSSKTGAPMLLLHLAKWVLKNRPNVQVDILSINKGALDVIFRGYANKFYQISEKSKFLRFVFLAIHYLKKVKIFSFLSQFENLALNRKLKRISKGRYDCIYANTILSIDIAERLIEYAPNSNTMNSILDIHELDAVIEIYKNELADHYKLFNHIIVGSNYHKERLIKKWNAPEKKIRVINDFTSTFSIEKNKPSSEKIFTVGAMGGVHWRKGHDVFIQVARYIRKHYKDYEIQFKWVGAISSYEKIVVSNDIEKLELSESVSFLGEDDNYQNYFSDFDLFLLTSREDAFPLVAVEAGLAGLPIICFENSTGIAEHIQNKGGFVVPYLDIEEMAKKIIHYYDNQEKRKNDGLNNEASFINFTSKETCPQIYSLMVDGENN